MIEMICPGPEKLTAYLLGDLAEPELGAVAEHLDSCADCAAEADRLEGMNDTVLSHLRRIPARRPRPPVESTETEVFGPGGSARGGAVPEEWGDFRIVREIGRGGMGVVCEAYQGSLNRHVALKFLPEHGDLARFRREARAAGRLHHTNIVPVFGVGEHEGRPYYVMQFIPGRGLDSVIAEGKRPTDWRGVARIGLQVANALAYAHAQGVIHRDIKPSNLLIDDRSVVWVADFGLAKADDGPDLTRTGDVLGTLRYMPPEAFEGRAGARGDVYALGLTLYEVLALRPAFDEKERGPLVRRITAGEVPRLERLEPEVPRDLVTIVHKAIERDPSHRYGSAAELAEDLRRFLDDEPIRARRMSTVDRLGRWVRRHKAVAALSAVASFLLIAVTVISLLAAIRLKKERDAVLDEKHRADQAELEILRNRVRALLDTSPDTVPYILGELQKQRSGALSLLRELAATAQEPAATAQQRSLIRHRLAVAKAVIGDRDDLGLCWLVTECPPSEAKNLMLGLRSLPVRIVLEDLNGRYRGTISGTGRTRLAIALLELGDPGAAREELSLRENLTDRVRFIHEFPTWHGDLEAPLAQLKSTGDPAFRSGLILAIGGVSPESLSPANRATLTDLSAKLFLSAPDGATHSAALVGTT